jgi:lipopolysaccharide export system protein LptA
VKRLSLLAFGTAAVLLHSAAQTQERALGLAPDPIFRSGSSLLRDVDPLGGGTGRAAPKPLGYEDTPLAPAKAERTEKKPKGQTEITALEATFDQKTREAVFLGDVTVQDPEFTVTCDRLTALLKKQKTGGEKPAGKPSPTPAKGSSEPKGGGGLEKAIAEANPGKQVVITQNKVEADGSVVLNIGKGRKTVYNAATGDIVLTGSPSVQQGINLCVAESDETVMTLNRNGRMKVQGPHRTTIKDTNSIDGAR